MNNLKIKVSVIIPIYNRENEISKCIISVINQSLSPIEIICVNDGSTDGSGQIIDAFCEKYDCIIKITQNNLGAGEARNSGLKVARGEFVIFVDPDDYLVNSNVLRKLYNTAIEKNVRVCGGSIILVDMYDNKAGELPEKRSKSSVNESGYMSFREYQYPYAHQRYLIEREFLVDNKIQYPQYVRGQDLPFMVNVLHSCNVFYLLAMDVYAFRVGHKKIKFDVKSATDWIEAFKCLIEISIENNYELLFKECYEEINSFAKNYLYCICVDVSDWKLVDYINESIYAGFRKFNFSGNMLLDKAHFEKEADYIISNVRTLINNLKTENYVVIYGAGFYGKRIFEFLTISDVIIKEFWVTSSRKNEMIGDIPVKEYDKVQCEKNTSIILAMESVETKRDITNKLVVDGANKIYDFDLRLFCWGLDSHF